MKRTIIALATASVLGFASAVTAEQQLSTAQLDGVTAGGVAIATSLADAIGVVTGTLTQTVATVQSVGSVPAQVGEVQIILSNAAALSEAAATAGATAVGISGASGTTQGTLASDTESTAQTLADAPNLFAGATATNTSVSAEIVLGVVGGSSSTAQAAAALTN